MSQALPPLRRNLDLMPSPLSERPGLLMRDPFRYAEAILVIPSPLVPCLAFFNGKYNRADVAEALVRLTGDVRMGQVVDHLRDTLSQQGFLEDEVLAGLRERRHRAFAEAARREAVHAGQAYPAAEDELRRTLTGWLDGGFGDGDGDGGGPVIGIAAPHVSPEGGWRCYQAAYGALRPEDGRRTAVILGTSHYGEPETFGLTRKAFVTPYGEAAVAVPLVDRLAEEGGSAVRLEDYCHSVEHSIEFQVVFLQHLFGAGLRIVPILCGPFQAGTRAGGRPEDDEGVGRFLEALAGLAAAEGDGLLWVLGVDMAHMGRRYGDPFLARAEEGLMLEVAERDRARCERIAAGDADGFWSLLRENGDDLKWCGASSLYAFLRAAGPAAGRVARYEQWNIDDGSVVSFAGMAFRRPRSGAGDAKEG